ncbi:MAG: efflux RND transporter periplasmic adaptor subunit [Desulfovibrio sp.]|nr:efflux RND transporter periplasmic adaptor subunit [Desulfovibrio sp.]
MRKIFVVLLLLLCTALPVHGKETLTYEGKVVAQMVRPVSVPFPAMVDALLTGIGDTVSRGQKLLQYHLEAGDARTFQKELLTGGALADMRIQMASLEQELLNANTQRRSSAELAAKGLTSQTDAGRNARNYNLLQSRMKALKQKEAAHKADFSLRLEELESYFGHKLKMGDRLPRELFLTAPLDGTVVDISPKARPLGRIEPNAAALTLAVIDPIQVQIQVHESEINKMAVGDAVTVELVNLNRLKVTGRVATLSWQPTDPKIAVPSFYYVYIDVDNKEQRIKPGYKVLVHIATE